MDPDAFDLSSLPWLAIGLSFAAMVALGFLWYAPFTPTGKLWMRAKGLDPANLPAPPQGALAVSLLLMVVGSFLMMFVFAHTNMAYEDAFRNAATGGAPGYELRLSDTMTGAFLTWLGFIVPVQLNAVAFDRKPWSLFAVDGGYYLAALLVAGALLALV